MPELPENDEPAILSREVAKALLQNTVVNPDSEQELLLQYTFPANTHFGISKKADVALKALGTSHAELSSARILNYAAERPGNTRTEHGEDGKEKTMILDYTYSMHLDRALVEAAAGMSWEQAQRNRPAAQRPAAERSAG